MTVTDIRIRQYYRCFKGEIPSKPDTRHVDSSPDDLWETTVAKMDSHGNGDGWLIDTEIMHYVREVVDHNGDKWLRGKELTSLPYLWDR